MKEKSVKSVIAFTGGGSAGHIIPGLAVIDACKEIWNESVGEKCVMNPDLTYFWICSRKKSERALLDDLGIQTYTIHAGKLRRYFSLKNVIDFFSVLAGTLEALWIMIKRKPALLFSKGGYVSLPPVLAAGICRIPIVIHESDYDPGLTTRFSMRIASAILIPYKASMACYPRKYQSKLVVTGNPVRKELLFGSKEKGLAYCGVKTELPVVLVLGGSLGAIGINKIFEGCLESLTEKYFVIHQTGEHWSTDFRHENYRQYSYLGKPLADIIAMSDLVVSRAGAGAISELALVGKPMILIPLSSAVSRGDQIRNAAYFEYEGAAVVIKEKIITSEGLKNAIIALAEDPEKRKTLGGHAASLSVPGAAAAAAGILIAKIRGEFV
ncbi:MAG: UDP-N-acetylglucosamine--N-acetylmuramyl-(pentapeptide) pyrophosphoryl-undecaprenol N-acetylglucosamine transferase [Spirochaetia bacterium]|nr:UDP-N-acetylglucosamine--N-acetylmuramyl-(pentapeptide) pyrophosphoryl-undecaprenol N-acetylglucosamine transferase [Spirochaetia bacterium]